MIGDTVVVTCQCPFIAVYQYVGVSLVIMTVFFYVSPSVGHCVDCLCVRLCQCVSSV